MNRLAGSNPAPSATLGHVRTIGFLVPGEGFEPPTFGLQNRCTATVLTRPEIRLMGAPICYRNRAYLSRQFLLFLWLGSRARADKLVERHRRGIGDVERGLRGASRQPRKEITALAHQTAQAAALRAEHDRNPLAERQVGQRPFSRLIETANPEPRHFQPIEGFGKVDHADERYSFEGAGSSLGQRTRRARGAAIRDNHRGRAEGGSRTQYRTNVMRIADLVEPDDDTTAELAAGVPQYIIQVALAQRFGFER